MWNSMFYSAQNGQINTTTSNPISLAFFFQMCLCGNSFRSGAHHQGNKNNPLQRSGILELKKMPSSATGWSRERLRQWMTQDFWNHSFKDFRHKGLNPLLCGVYIQCSWSGGECKDVTKLLSRSYSPTSLNPEVNSWYKKEQSKGCSNFPYLIIAP